MKNLTWKEVQEEYNRINKSKITESYSSSAEIKLLTTPELVLEYIKKYSLSSSNEIELLTTPELVSEYIKKSGLCSSSAKVIFSKFINKGDN